MGSARTQPVARITAPAIAVAMNAKRSVRRCWKLPLDVERLPVCARELPGGDEVHADADQGDDEDHAALCGQRRDEPPNGAVDDQAGEDEQRRTVRLRGEDLGAPQPERPVAVRRLGREPQHEERHRERARVGEHVRRVGEERERVREDASDDLAGHEGEDQRERQP